MTDQLEAGSRLGPYVIVSALGAGGMGQVYRAHDSRLDRDVAVKVLSRNLARDEEALGRLRREAKTVAALSHPNILSIFDIGVEGEDWYLVTELLHGKTVREVLEEGETDPATVRAWGIVIAEAIGEAHARGVIHRDIKPENIFITDEGRIKILDFGLARSELSVTDQSQIKTQSFVTQDGMILGTVGYMSPEQIRAESTGPESDVFSLGCVLYEMLAGKPPFLRKTPVATLTSIVNDEPEPLPPSVDEDVRSAISHCLEKDPRDRFSNGKELADALRGAEQPASSARHLMASIAVVLLLVAVTVAGYFIFVKRESPAVEPLTADVGTHSLLGPKLLVMSPVAAGVPPPPEYLSAAIQSEVERELSRQPDIRVLPAGSTEVLTRSENSEELLSELGVDAILRTIVSGEPPDLVIDLELEYLGGARHAVSVRAEDLSTASSLAITELDRLLGVPGTAAPTKPVTDPEAIKLYYQARNFWSKRSAEGVSRSIELYRKALDIDPEFALAYAGLADSYAVLHNAAELPTRETFPRARAAAERALEIDPGLVEAMISLAYIDHYYELDWQSAEAGYRAALELQPDNATAHQWLAELLVVTGRHEEARREIDRALELDPLSPVVGVTTVWLEFMMRDYDRALERGRTAIATNPGDPRALAYLGRALTEMKRYPEAEKMHRAAVEVSGKTVMKLWLAETLARAGQAGQARALVDQIESGDEYVNPYYHALPYIALGDHDRALDLLETASEAKVEQRAWFGVDPSLDPLRASSRFETLVSDRRLRDVVSQ